MELPIVNQRVEITASLVDELNNASEQDLEPIKLQLATAKPYSVILPPEVNRLNPTKLQAFLDNAFAAYEYLSITINKPSFELVKSLLTTNTFHKLDLPNDFFCTLTFEQVQEIATLCGNRSRVQLFNINSYNLEAVKHLKCFSYQQQQEIAGLYLECIFKKQVNFCTNLNLHLLDFDLVNNPNAYYDLLDLFINRNSYVKWTETLINYCKDDNVISAEQACTLILKSLLRTNPISDFDCMDHRIENVCRFINEVCDHNSIWTLHNELIKNYKFKDIGEKILYIEAVYAVNHNYIFLDLNLEETEAATTKFRTATYMINYISTNKDKLNQAQKIVLLETVMKYDSSYLPSNLGLDIDVALSYFKRFRTTSGLIDTLINAKWTKDKILAFVEDFIKELDPNNNYLYFEQLDMSKDEIIAFVNRNPAWGNVIENWIRNCNNKNKPVTQEVLDELLRKRMENPPSHINQSDLALYKVTDEKLADILLSLPENISIEAEIWQKLDWATCYSILKGLLHQSDYNVAIIKYTVSQDKLPLRLKLFFEQINLDLDLSNEIESIDAAKEILLNLFTETIIAFMSVTKVEELRLEKINNLLQVKQWSMNDVMQNYSLYFWALNLFVRLIEEVEPENLQAVFKHTAFAATLEEIATLAAPHLRRQLINDILTIANSSSKLSEFEAIAANANKRSLIPALIITCQIQDTASFSEVLNLIGTEYNDKILLRPLLNAMLALFYDKELSEQEKLKILNKILKYNLLSAQVDTVEDLKKLHAERVINKSIVFNCMYITKVMTSAEMQTKKSKKELQEEKHRQKKEALKFKDNKDSAEFMAYKAEKAKLKQEAAKPIFGLQGFDQDGQIIDIPDIAQEKKLAGVHSLLLQMHSNFTSIDRNTKQVLAELHKTHMFGFGKDVEQQAISILQGLAVNKLLAIMVKDPQFAYTSWTHSYGQLLQNCFNISSWKLPTTIQQLATCRNQETLITYYARLKLVPAQQQFVKLLQLFVRLISSPQAKNFYRYRYDYTQQPQFKAATESNPNLRKLWQLGIEVNYKPYAALLKQQFTIIQNKDINIKDYLSKRICHFEHLPKSQFPFIHAYLTASDDAEKLLISEKVKAEITAYGRGNQAFKVKLAKLKLQEGLIEYFAQEQNFDAKNKYKKLNVIKNLCYDCYQDSIQFCRDMGSLTDQLFEQNSVKQKTNGKSVVLETSKWKIADTDHWWDLFLTGTEVPGSCQDVNGNPQYNRCLIGGYVLSGHIRQIAIFNENKEIVARAILRLMIDITTSEPVLFLEDIYPDACAEYSLAIKNFAKIRAWQLGCTLVTKDSTIESTYPNQLTVVAVKGAEYVDAIGTQQTKGYYLPEGSANILFDYKSAQKKLPQYEQKASKPLQITNTASVRLDML